MVANSNALTGNAQSSALVTEASVREALNTVMDPHMNVSLPDMGMVRRVDVDSHGVVEVGLVFPCVGCPAWDLIQADIKKTVGELANVKRVKVKVEWHHEWNRNDITPDARIIAKEHGYII
ncbi:MAG: metal-sulfur cluster assembly factor [Pseudomonadales bacterium]